MKIRSHTGNYVEARSKMRCTVEKSSIPVTIETIDGDCAWCSFNVCSETRKMVYTASHLNMKFCPFAVGDELQRNDRDTGDWESIGSIVRSNSIYHITDRGAEVLIAGENYVRHASHDLRPAEGYGV